MKVKTPKEIINEPSDTEVKRWLKEWDGMSRYTLQEEALSLIVDTCKGNTSLKCILAKVMALDSFYSTNLYYQIEMAERIKSISDFDDRVQRGDLSLVENISVLEYEKEIEKEKVCKTKNCISFASKYCNWHNKEAYPIYDSYVRDVLAYLRTTFTKLNYDPKKLTEYVHFHAAIEEIREVYNLHYSMKDMDRYLWTLGKKCFPKQYGKKEKTTSPTQK